MSGGGFSFGNTAGSTAGTAGFGLSSGFGGFGATANKNAAGAASTTGFGTAGVGLGGTATGFGAAGAAAGATSAVPTVTPLAAPGFNFGGAANSTGLAKPATTITTGGLGGGLGGFGATPAKTATATTTGFGASTGLGGFGTTTGLAATTTAATGFSFGSSLGTTGTAKPPLMLGGFGTTAAVPTTTAPAAGFGGFGGGLGSIATTKPGLTLGGFGTTTAAPSTGFSLGGGLGGAVGTSTLGAATSLFANPITTTASKGLGGVDPKKTATATGISGTNGKPGDSKAVKETAMPNEITFTVENFKKYVKEQRSVREEIDRMSSKQMYKVQEEVAALKQWLSLVSTGLQRNAVAIDKLKQESAQELKNAEIAQRTKDLPPGLQYENTAPTEYFARMIDDFECRMVLYRQQIEEMESHLASLQQPTMLTPQELSKLLKKIYDSFVHLAAQLQIIHEAVKAQKKQYLNYRKVFHGDSTDVFEKRRKAVEKARTTRSLKTVGPTPFTGMSNAAAMAMATAMNRAQQPAGGAPTLGLNTGLGTTGLGTQTGGLGTGLGTGIFGGAATGTTGGLTTGGFGSTGFGTSMQSSQPSGFGSSSFNFGATNTATVRPLGSTFGSTGSNALGAGLFGASSVAGVASGFGFGATQSAGFGTQPNTAGALNLTTTGGFGVSPQDSKQPFLLQKPPVGNKKGKKT